MGNIWKTSIENLEKQGEFLPSNALNAPQNPWQEDSNLEIPLEPDSISDEETFFAPCTVGKPRNPDMWEQAWHMMKKPFSKKEVESASDTEQEEIEKQELGENETLLEYSKSFKDLNRLDSNKPKTDWSNPNPRSGEPYSPLPVTYDTVTNENNENWRFPYRFTRRPIGEDSDQGKTIEMLEEQEKRKACIERLTRDITAGTYSASVPDYQGEQYYNEQHTDNGGEVNYVNKDHVDNGYGFRDFNDSSTDYPKPEDISPAVVHLDILQKPFNRTDAFGIDWYQVQWYLGASNSQGIESVNPD